MLNTGTDETARNSLFYLKNVKEDSSPKLTALKNEIIEEGNKHKQNQQKQKLTTRQKKNLQTSLFISK